MPVLYIPLFLSFPQGIDATTGKEQLKTADSTPPGQLRTVTAQPQNKSNLLNIKTLISEYFLQIRYLKTANRILFLNKNILEYWFRQWCSVMVPTEELPIDHKNPENSSVIP